MGVISMAAQFSHDTLVIYHNTYPERPTQCVSNLVGRVPYSRKRFESKRQVFEAAASQFGIDTTNARFVEKRERIGGGIADLTKLFVPGEGEDYYSIGFFS